jgi:hypothetical protein
VIGDVVYLSTFSGNSTIGYDLGTGRRVFNFDDGEYGPVVSDGEKLYLTGGSTVIAFDPIDLEGYKYKSKSGQKGVVPPAERRRAMAAIRKRGPKDDDGKKGGGPKGDRKPSGGKGARRGGKPQRGEGQPPKKNGKNPGE